MKRKHVYVNDEGRAVVAFGTSGVCTKDFRRQLCLGCGNGIGYSFSVLFAFSFMPAFFGNRKKQVVMVMDDTDCSLLLLDLQLLGLGCVLKGFLDPSFENKAV